MLELRTKSRQFIKSIEIIVIVVIFVPKKKPSTMSTKKPITARGIYEATEKEYNTTDYRQKLCNQWISFQNEQPASVHVPSDLESNVSHKTPGNRQRKHSKRMHLNENVSAKRIKNDGGQPKVNSIFENLKHDDNIGFGDEFLDFTNNQLVNDNAALSHKKGLSKEEKIVHSISTSGKRLQNHPKSNSQKHRSDVVNFKDFQIDFNAQQHVQFSRSTKKKSKEETCHDDVGFDEFDENPLNPSKSIERKRHSDTHDMTHRNDFRTQRRLLDNNVSPQHVIYKSIKKSSYALIEATPIMSKANELNDHFFTVSKRADDDVLFKKPDNRYIEHLDVKKSKYRDRSKNYVAKAKVNSFSDSGGEFLHLDIRNNYLVNDNAAISNKNPLENREKIVILNVKNSEHRERRNEKLSDELTIFDEIQAFNQTAVHTNNDDIPELKIIPKLSATQPTVFNIRCNNLIIKTE